VSRCDRNIKISRGDEWNTEVKTASVLSATTDAFLLTNSLEAFEGDVRVFAKTWSKSIPRDHV
jgi:hypothetical protein